MRKLLRRRLRRVALAGLGILLLPWLCDVAARHPLEREHALGVRGWRMEIPGARSLAMQALPGGACWMGSAEQGSLARAQVGAFSLCRHEVRVRDFVVFLNRYGVSEADAAVFPQVVWARGKFRARMGEADRPMAYVTREDAAAYCTWLSFETGRSVRLPTEAEWEYAARAGLAGAPYPNGWQVDPNRRAASAHRVMRGSAANAFGLYDMAGNVFEWCLPVLGEEGAVARGGAFTERAEEMFRVYQRAFFSSGYRDRDVGFRVVVAQ